MKFKRGVIWESLLPWMIGIGVLVLALVLYWIFSGKSAGALSFIKDLFQYG